MVRDSHKIAEKNVISLENTVFNCDRKFKFKSKNILKSEAVMLSGIPMNNHNWMIHVCSSTVVNCANYLSPKTKQPIIKIKSLCHNPYFQNMVLILYAHSLPLCIAKSNVIPHHKVNGQYS